MDGAPPPRARRSGGPSTSSRPVLPGDDLAPISNAARVAEQTRQRQASRAAPRQPRAAPNSTAANQVSEPRLRSAPASRTQAQRNTGSPAAAAWIIDDCADGSTNIWRWDPTHHDHILAPVEEYEEYERQHGRQAPHCRNPSRPPHGLVITRQGNCFRIPPSGQRQSDLRKEMDSPPDAERSPPDDVGAFSSDDLSPRHNGLGQPGIDRVSFDSPPRPRRTTSSWDDEEMPQVRRSPRTHSRSRADGTAPGSPPSFRQRYRTTGSANQGCRDGRWPEEDTLGDNSPPRLTVRRHLLFRDPPNSGPAFVPSTREHDPFSSNHRHDRRPPGGGVPKAQRGGGPVPRFIPDMSRNTCEELRIYLQIHNPEVLSGLALYLSWDTEQMKLVKRLSKDDFTLDGARGEAARFAHFIDIDHVNAGRNPEKDGKLLRNAAAYARPGYESHSFDSTKRDSYVKAGRKIWNEATTHFVSSSSFPNDTLSRLKNHVSVYFKHRMNMAHEDFEGTPAQDIARAAAQQARDVDSLWTAYEKRILTELMPPNQQNRLYFDLFYPFFRTVMNVADMDRPQLAPRSAQMPTGFQASVSPAVCTGMWGSFSHGQSPQQADGYLSPGPTHALYTSSGQPWSGNHSGPIPGSGGWTPASGPQASSFSATGSGGFVGKRVSHSVVGASLGIHIPGVPTCPTCPMNPSHFTFECPMRYFKKTLHPCPGFDQSGYRVQSAWTRNDISSQTKVDWRAYIRRHGLQDAHRAGGRSVDFN